MRTAPQVMHTDGPLLLSAFRSAIGTPGLELGDEHGVALTIYALHNLPERVARLAEVGQAVLDGRQVIILPEDRDAEHAASAAGRLAAEIESGAIGQVMTDCDSLRLVNRALHREAAEAGDRVRAEVLSDREAVA